MLIAAGATGVGVYAGKERGKPDRNAGLVQQDAQPEKIVRIGDGEEKTVTYVGTDEENSSLDVYEDEAGTGEVTLNEVYVRVHQGQKALQIGYKSGEAPEVCYHVF